MTPLGPVAIRIRNADAASESGNGGDRVYGELLALYDKTDADELWTEALNELDAAYGTDRGGVR